MAEMPTGAVTFLFTDIESSTRLVKQLRESYREGGRVKRKSGCLTRARQSPSQATCGTALATARKLTRGA